MRQEEPDRTAACIIEFCQFARTNGLSAGVQQTLAAIEVARTIGGVDRRDFAHALRTVLSSSKEEWDLFDQLFDAFWSASRRKSVPAPEETMEAKVSAYAPEASSRTLTYPSDSAASPPEGEGKAVSGASVRAACSGVNEGVA